MAISKKLLFVLLFFLAGISVQAQAFEFIAKVNSDSIIVGTSRVQLPANPEAAWIQIMHEHATAKVYLGGEDLAILNGFGALENLDTTERYIIQDTDVFYLISDTPGVVVKYMWGD